MIEEPYRWVEAIANRREYIEHHLATGSPIVALSYAGGILLLTLGRERQKIFEIYDRIGMGGIGHPGDIERLRMAAIEVASTEGFARSSHDVSLRRLANYSLSPALKAAFEQIYGPPYLARLLFAELGRAGAPNLFVRLEYDGTLHTNGGSFARTFQDFGVISGTASSAAAMQRYLGEQSLTGLDLESALNVATKAWAVGHFFLADPDRTELPSSDVIAGHWREQLGASAVEAALLEDSSPMPVMWRALREEEIRPILEARM
jgi:proteasome alpha subunit